MSVRRKALKKMNTLLSAINIKFMEYMLKIMSESRFELFTAFKGVLIPN